MLDFETEWWWKCNKGEGVKQSVGDPLLDIRADNLVLHSSLLKVPLNYVLTIIIRKQNSVRTSLVLISTV